MFSSDDTVGDLEGKMLLHYNAKACGHAMCVDLSSNENNGRLVGQQCSTSDIKVNKLAVWFMGKTFVHDIVTFFLIHSVVHNAKL